MPLELLDDTRPSVSDAERYFGGKGARAGWSSRMALDLREEIMATQVQTHLVRRDGAMGRLHETGAGRETIGERCITRDKGFTRGRTSCSSQKDSPYFHPTKVEHAAVREYSTHHMGPSWP